MDAFLFSTPVGYSAVCSQMEVRWRYAKSCLTLTPLSSFEDFVECFALWAEESPDGANSVFNTISNHQESQITVCTLTLIL
jgi:hypothetical protein